MIEAGRSAGNDTAVCNIGNGSFLAHNDFTNDTSNSNNNMASRHARSLSLRGKSSEPIGSSRRSRTDPNVQIMSALEIIRIPVGPLNSAGTDLSSTSDSPPTTPRLNPSNPEDHPLFHGRLVADAARQPAASRCRVSSASRERGDPENERPRRRSRARALNEGNRDLSPAPIRSLTEALRSALLSNDPEALLAAGEQHGVHLGHPEVSPALTAIRDTEGVDSRPLSPTMASNAFPALDTSVGAAGNRSAGASPTAPSMNGNGINGPSAANAAAYMPPLPVGHQQDLNHLFNQIQELGSMLRSNRDKVNNITKDAEEVAKRANGALTNGEDAGTSENDSTFLPHPSLTSKNTY